MSQDEAPQHSTTVLDQIIGQLTLDVTETASRMITEGRVTELQTFSQALSLARMEEGVIAQAEKVQEAVDKYGLNLSPLIKGAFAKYDQSRSISTFFDKWSWRLGIAGTVVGGAIAAEVLRRDVIRGNQNSSAMQVAIAPHSKAELLKKDDSSINYTDLATTLEEITNRKTESGEHVFDDKTREKLTQEIDSLRSASQIIDEYRTKNSGNGMSLAVLGIVVLALSGFFCEVVPSTTKLSRSKAITDMMKAVHKAVSQELRDKGHEPTPIC